MNFLELERKALEDQLAAARAAGADAPVDLQRRRADLQERIARHRG